MPEFGKDFDRDTWAMVGDGPSQVIGRTSVKRLLIADGIKRLTCCIKPQNNSIKLDVIESLRGRDRSGMSIGFQLLQNSRSTKNNRNPLRTLAKDPFNRNTLKDRYSIIALSLFIVGMLPDQVVKHLPPHDSKVRKPLPVQTCGFLRADGRAFNPPPRSKASAAVSARFSWYAIIFAWHRCTTGATQSIEHQAESWNKQRTVMAKVIWHRDELFRRIGFVVTNQRDGAKPVIDFHNLRGTAEQWIKKGKIALNWTRLNYHDFDDNQVRLQRFVLAHNLGNFLRRLALPTSVKHWTLTTLLVKLIKTGAKVVITPGT